MRKIFFIFFLFSVQAIAQNYQTVNSMRQYYYHIPYFSNAYPQSAAIKIDSAFLSVSDSTFYPFRIFGDWDNTCIGYNTIDTSWLGEKIILRSNGDNIFYNNTGDSSVIKTTANLNDTWHLLDFSNGDYIEATLSSVSYQSVIVSNDSVKTITLQAKNSSGNNISHIFNGRQILPGKYFGFIQVYNFHLLPVDTSTYTLKGITNPSFGAQNITASYIFDFAVGDIFQYRGTFGCGIGGGNGFRWYEDTITSKNVSGDTITYVKRHTFYKIDYYLGPDTFFYNGYDTVQYILSRWATLVDKLPKERTSYY